MEYNVKWYCNDCKREGYGELKAKEHFDEEHHNVTIRYIWKLGSWEPLR